MIEIEIIQSPDPEVMGLRSFCKNIVYIGNNKGDVLIRDDKIIDYHLTIEVNAYNIYAHIHPNIPYFHLNGKRTSGIINLVPGNLLTIGNTTIAFKDASYQEELSKRDILNTKLNQLIEADAPELEILALLEQRVREYKQEEEDNADK